MNATVLYTVVAALTIVAVFLLLRAGHATRVVDTDIDQEFLEGLWDSQCLMVVEKIFDPLDYRWLRDQAGLVPFAESLFRARQQLALTWLRAMRRSFDDLIRTPELPPADNAHGEAERGWKMLWVTLRFHFLLTYAYFVVRYFGPYHRLVPFSWVRAFSTSLRRERYVERDLAHLS